MTRTVIQFRCTEDQKRSIEQTAESLQVSVASYLLALHEGTGTAGKQIENVIKTPAAAKETVKALPAPKQEEGKRRPPTEEELGYAGLKKGAVEGVDWWWRGNKVVKANQRG